MCTREGAFAFTSRSSTYLGKANLLQQALSSLSTELNSLLGEENGCEPASMGGCRRYDFCIFIIGLCANTGGR